MNITRHTFILIIVLTSIIQFIGIECKNVTELSTPQEIFNAYFKNLSLDIWNKQMPRSPATEKCIELYRAKNYEVAIEKMSKLAETTPQKDQWVLRLYWGICHLNLNQPKEAYTLFNQIDPNSSVGEAALWYKALAFIQSDKVEQAKSSLKKVELLENTYHKKATEILTLLGNL